MINTYESLTLSEVGAKDTAKIIDAFEKFANGIVNSHFLRKSGKFGEL